MKNTIVVAYSGGLDTSVMVKWLHETYNANIITYTANLGQHINNEELESKAYKTGADHVIIEDLQDEFVNDYITPAILGNALYENQYPLATALGRPLIAKKLVETAHIYGADTISHGCTGKGNDQIRLEVGIQSLDPSMKVIAPLRYWEFKSRDQEIDYALKHNIPISITKKSPYSIDENLWGTSVECGILENLEEEPPEEAFQITNELNKTPNVPKTISLTFENGIPTSLNGVYKSLKNIIYDLNEIGSQYGIGRIDLVENRVIGIKSREIYESPAATLIIKAHSELEKIVLDKDTFRAKHQIDQSFSNLIYDGFWFSPLREAYQSFLYETQKKMTGEIKLKLYKGNILIVSRKSEFSLYRNNLATYSIDDEFNHQAAEGFIELYGLNQKVISSVNKNKKEALS